AVKTSSSSMNRRDFTNSFLLAGAALVASASKLPGARLAERRIRTGVIGCGSVSNSYLLMLTASPLVEVVSLCDIKLERARRQAERFKVAHHYPHIDDMLAGEPFEFLVDLTDMQAHEGLNRRA